jgi:hypothetical protein
MKWLWRGAFPDNRVLPSAEGADSREERHDDEGEGECSDRRFYTVAATPAQVGITLRDKRRFVGGLLIPPVCRAPILIETDLV